jgi:hypothetical protein
MKIITSFDYPPIPYRGADWSAVTDNYEPGHPMGHGATEQAAIDHLLQQLDCTQDQFEIECYSRCITCSPTKQ